MIADTKKQAVTFVVELSEQEAALIERALYEDNPADDGRDELNAPNYDLFTGFTNLLSAHNVTRLRD